MFLSHGTACQTNTCMQTGITLSTVCKIMFNGHILCIVYDYSTLVWARWFKSYPMKDKNPFIIRSQYYGCWWPGDTRSHAIDREGNDFVVPEFSGSTPGPRFNIKMSSYQYRKSHCGDKTVVRSSYLHNGISYTGKTTSLYWIRAQLASFLIELSMYCSKTSKPIPQYQIQPVARRRWWTSSIPNDPEVDRCGMRVWATCLYFVDIVLQKDDLWCRYISRYLKDLRAEKLS